MKYKIHVDQEAAREEAEHLESLIIEAKDEDEADSKAQEIIKKHQYGGPYYAMRELDEKGEMIFDA
jgi:hypothetical protein|tara:strand:+ start:625 stop:822 length:198 start_codon:yes stop_codon:yes gene_type:complete